jgi:hypothetical protein
VRCATCEEPIDVLDICEQCERHNVDKQLPTLRGQKRSISAIKGVCIRGHSMRWADVRWRCKQCEAMYAQRKRLRRKVNR